MLKYCFKLKKYLSSVIIMIIIPPLTSATPYANYRKSLILKAVFRFEQRTPRSINEDNKTVYQINNKITFNEVFPNTIIDKESLSNIEIYNVKHINAFFLKLYSRIIVRK